MLCHPADPAWPRLLDVLIMGQKICKWKNL
jgi:hypothetical protein